MDSKVRCRVKLNCVTVTWWYGTNMEVEQKNKLKKFSVTFPAVTPMHPIRAFIKELKYNDNVFVEVTMPRIEVVHLDHNTLLLTAKPVEFQLVKQSK